LTLQLDEAEQKIFWSGVQNNYLVVKLDQ
jgi:hypothetical protein